VRDYASGSDFRWEGGRIRLEFDGNRIDVIAGAGGAYHAAEADVLIDGKKRRNSRSCISLRGLPTHSKSTGRR